MKNVHHEIHVVEQHPPALRQPFYMMRHAAAGPERGHQVLRHPPHARIRRSRHDHEEIRRGGQATQVEHHRVDAFAVDERRRHELQRRQRIAARAPHRTPAPPATHSAPSACLFRPLVSMPRPHISSMAILVRTLSGRLFLNYRHLRSEEHTSELQSRSDLVCRLLLEKKKTTVYKIAKTVQT